MVFLGLMGALFALGGCRGEEEVAEIPTEIIDDGKGEQIHTIANSPEVAAYFAEGDLVYHDIEQESDATLMTSAEQEVVAAAYNAQIGTTGTEWAVTYEDIEWLYNWYNVATVTKAPYEGWHLMVLEVECEGPCFTANLYRFLWDESTGERVFLPEYSDDYLPGHLSPLTDNAESAFELSGLELPETIDVPEIYGEGKVLTLEESSQDYLLIAEEYEVMFESEAVGAVYKTGTGCFYVQAPDGSVARYTYDAGFGFMNDENGASVEVSATWTATGETTNFTVDYGFMPSGCGLTGGCYLLSEAELANLTPVATTSNGETLYAVADPKEGATIEAGDTVEQVALSGQYDTYKMFAEWELEENPEATVMTFEEYVAENPLLYWRDPFDRWTMVVHNSYRPVAECGKPVVYLYPEETMEVSVKVGIDDLTVSIPEHGEDGWTVNATPAGELTNVADGQTYPYLFWEGNSYDGIEATRGFVIARRHVVDFLETALAKLGLNKVERTDFMEFWAPRMLENPEPYFFVSFIGTADFNAIAPLEITPKPDTLIRVFMAYRPIQTPFKVEPQTLSSIPRSGFTVIEWGGTASVPWQPE